MRDTDPVVLRRMLALRHFPLLGGVQLDELATLAENVVELVLPSGAGLPAAEPDGAVATFVLDGRIASRDRRWGPGEVHGGLEVLAGRGLAQPAVVERATRALQLATGDLRDVLEDNFGVLLSVLHALADRILAAGLLRAPAGVVPGGPRPLGLVDQLLLLRGQPPLARVPIGVLASLAAGSVELEMEAGEVVARAGEVATRALVLVDGVLVARDDGSVHRPGAAIGLLEMLAGARHALTVEAVAPVRILASDSATLVDVLEDQPEAALSILATLAGVLLDAPRA